MIKNRYILLLCALSISLWSVAQKSNIKNTKHYIEYRVDSVLAKMTLEEKVGQMAQYTVDVIGKGGNLFTSDEPFALNNAMLDTVLGKYKVGSILNTANNRARTTEVWEKTIKAIQQRAIKETGIPVVYGIDAIHGVTYTAGATFFPQEIGMAATFNRDLVTKGAEITAYETRASNIPWNFSPTMDVGRDARWSRIWESFGEDTYVNAEMGTAVVRGYQGDNHNAIGPNSVAACLKHYIGYGVPLSGKDRTPAIISENDLREKFFEPFRAAIIDGNALSIMVNSGMINGVSTHADYRLLTEWLKEDLNFDGVVVTDWADVQNLLSRDHIVHDYKDAVRISINSGIDMVMEPYNLAFLPTLIDLVKSGEVSQSRIDDAVRRVLRMKFRLGLFDKPYWSRHEYPNFGSKQHEAAAKVAADESITLLKNENNILPIKKGSKILVTGPNANSMRTLNGGWSYSWQGEKTEDFAEQYNTIYEALSNKFGADNVKLEEGVTYNMAGQYFEENEPNIDSAVNAASDVDYIVLALGENSYCETPGNLEELSLSDNQIALALALQKTGKPVILVLNEGRPRLIRKIEPNSKAIVLAYLPGNFGGDALADILSGDINPSGKLPYTYPKFEQSLITYDHKPSQNLDQKMEGAYDYGAETSVQYSFGFGLSYTTFEYTNLKIDKKEFVPGELITISVDVKNTGSVTGKESLLLFTSDLVASLTPDVRRLRAFDKVELQPGQSKTVTFTMNADELAFVNADGKWTIEEGDFRFQVGDLADIAKCTQTKIWNTPNR